MNQACLYASTIILIGFLLGGCSNSEKEIDKTNRPYPGVGSWLSFNSACKDSNVDDWRCEGEYLVKLDSIKKKGDILHFGNWYDGTYYKTAVNCKKSEVYDYNPLAKGSLKYTSGYKFDPKGNLNGDASAGILFCELASSSSDESFRLSDENSWLGVNPLALTGKWIRYENEISNTKPYDWYFNGQISKQGNSVIYAVYGRYNPSETIWSKIWSAIRIATPGTGIANDKDAIYGWRRVNCDNGDRYEFLPYTPGVDDALASKVYRGVWLPKTLTALNISTHIRRTYC